MNKCVLFVDDERNNLNSFRKELKTSSYEKLFASSGKEAIKLFEKQEIHVLVADEQMPEMSGMELIKIVKAHYPLTVRIILTTDTDNSSIVDAMDQGEIFRSVRKPWSKEVLEKEITEAIIQSDILHQNYLFTKPLFSNVKPTERHVSTRIPRALIDEIPVPTIVLLQDGTTALFNEHAEDIFEKNLIEGFVLPLDKNIMKQIFDVFDSVSGQGLVSWESQNHSFRAYVRSMRAGDPYMGLLFIEKENRQ